MASAKTSVTPTTSAGIPRKFGREKQVSELTGIPIRTLQRWRLFGGGPEFFRVNRMILYDLERVEAFIRGNRAA